MGRSQGRLAFAGAFIGALIVAVGAAGASSTAGESGKQVAVKRSTNTAISAGLARGNKSARSRAPRAVKRAPRPTLSSLAAPARQPAAITGCVPHNVLIVYSDVGVPPAALQAQIAAEPGVVSVDLFDAEIATPTLDDLDGYRTVVAT